MSYFSEDRFKILTVRFCYSLIGLIILALFVENFIFSESMGLLGFREIDDVAFQVTLRSIHAGGRYLNINDYAYGWIFWAPMALITYPFYLINKYFSVAWPLIVVPRQISLAFAVASLYYLRKILVLKKIPEYACAVALLVFLLFPTVGYFSLRFGTVNAIMFFSLLTFYFALKDAPSTQKGRRNIILSFAVAGGIKLSGLLIGPIVFILVLMNYRPESLKEGGKVFIRSFLFFLFCLILFTNPMLLDAPFHFGRARDYWELLSHFISITKLSGDTLAPYMRFYNGVFGNDFNFGMLFILYFGFFLFKTQNKYEKILKYTLILGIPLIAAILMFSVNNSASLGSYFTSVSFLLIVGVIGLHSSAMRAVLLASVLFLALPNVIIRTSSHYSGRAQHWHHFNYFIQAKNSASEIENSALILKCLDLKKNSLGNVKHIFMDFTIRSTISALSYPKTCVSVAWNNFAEVGKYCSDKVNFIILDTKSIGFLSQTEFDKKISEVDAKLAKDYNDDRLTRKNLLDKGTFDGETYSQVCEFGSIKIFKNTQL